MLESSWCWLVRRLLVLCSTGLFNTTGQPAASLPIQRTAEQLPVGMQFVGRWGDEAALFNLAAELERVAPWPKVVTPA